MNTTEIVEPIRKPNLLVAIIVALFTFMIVVGANMTYLLHVMTESFNSVEYLYHIAGVAFVVMLILLALYVSEIGFKKVAVLLFIAVVVHSLQIISNLLFIFVIRLEDMQTLQLASGIYSAVSTILFVMETVLYVISGILLLTDAKDRLGIAVLLGVDTFFQAISIICILIQKYYMVYFFAKSTYIQWPDTFWYVLFVLRELLGLVFIVSVIYCFVKAYYYNENLKKRDFLVNK